MAPGVVGDGVKTGSRVRQTHEAGIRTLKLRLVVVVTLIWSGSGTRAEMDGSVRSYKPISKLRRGCTGMAMGGKVRRGRHV